MTINPLIPFVMVGVPTTVFLFHLYRFRGYNDVKIFILLVMPTVIVVEFLGVYFGVYEYMWNNYVLNSIFVAIGWISNIYPVMHISLYLVLGKNYFKHRNVPKIQLFYVAILTGIFAVIYDLFLDPIAVYLGIWSWNCGGPWYDIPIGNFIGWFFIASTNTFGYLYLSYREQKEKQAILISMFIIINIIVTESLTIILSQILATIG